jgi:hypothetical protein
MWIIAVLVGVIGWFITDKLDSIAAQYKESSVLQWKMLQEIRSDNKEHQQLLLEHEKQIGEHSWRITTLEKKHK